MSIWLLPREYGLVFRNDWDVVVCVEDIHYPLRFLMYARWLLGGKRHGRPRWLWWGHWVGRKPWRILKTIRKFLVDSGDGALTYAEEQREMLIAWGCDPRKIVSFNNTHIAQCEIEPLPLPPVRDTLNLLFVGRNLEHKRIDRLVDLAARLSFVRIRLIGPGMDNLRDIVLDRGLREQIEILPAKTGGALRDDYRWCHLVANPGHAGLLVVSAGTHGRPIVIDHGSRHAPEVGIARAARQPFLDWGNELEVDTFFAGVFRGELSVGDWALSLVECLRSDFTIESSVDRFASFIEVAGRDNHRLARRQGNNVDSL